MHVFNEFLCSKPPIFELNGKRGNDLSSHKFAKAEKVFLCKFSAYFRVSAEELCKLFSIKVRTFKNWKKGLDIPVNPLEIIIGDTMAQKNVKDKGVQTDFPVTETPAVVTRRKSFSSMNEKYQNVIVAQVMKEIIQSATLSSFSTEDSRKILSIAFQSMQSNSDANRILYRVLTDFKEAIEKAFERKETSVAVQLLSLFFRSFTRKKLEKRMSLRISPYFWNLCHRQNYRQNGNGTLEFSGITLRPHYNRSYNEERLSIEMLQRDYWTVEIPPVTECVLQVFRKQSYDQPPRRPKKIKRENRSNSLLQDGVDQMYHCSNPDCTAKFVSAVFLRKHEESGGHYFGKGNAIHTNTKRATKSGIWIPPTERINLSKVHLQIETEL